MVIFFPFHCVVPVWRGSVWKSLFFPSFLLWTWNYTKESLNCKNIQLLFWKLKTSENIDCKNTSVTGWWSILQFPPLGLSRKCMLLSFCLVTTKIWSEGLIRPHQHVTALGSWTGRVIALRSWTDRVVALSVTALFYLEDSRKIHLQGMRARGSKEAKRRAPQRTGVGEREREREPFGCSFICYCLPPGPALWKLDLVRSPVLPEVLTPVLGPSLDLPLFYVCGLFLSLSFSHHHFGLLFPILTT